MNTYRYNLVLSAIAFGLVALAGASRVRASEHQCSNETLHGDYAFTIKGQVFIPDGPTFTRDGVAMTHFDGNGVVTQEDFVMQLVNVGGVPVSSSVVGNPNGFTVGETGHYTVFPDCTGEMEIDFPPVLAGGAVVKVMFVLSDEGRAIHTTVYWAQPPGAAGRVPALIHSEGFKLAPGIPRS